MSKRVIQIEHVGPIDRLSIPLPEAGVVVLRGRNGVGKSHALAAVDSLISGRGKPPCRDGAARGIVDGFGARLTIGRSTRRTGEAEVLTLEGRLDISQLVQPPIKDEESADRHRIKALIQLSGQPADRTLFEKILPEGMALGELLPPSEQSEDPVVLAGRVKRALEAEARRWEDQAEQAQAEVSVLQSEVRVDPVVQLSSFFARIREQPDVVRAEAERHVAEAMAKLRELETRQEMAAKQAEQIAAAKQKLAELEAAELASPEAMDQELADLDAKILKLEQALAAAKERRLQLLRRREEAIGRQKQIADLRQIIGQSINTVSDAEIEAAQKAMETARRQLSDTIDLVRQAGLLDRLQQRRSQLAHAQAQADRWREAAHAADEVLSEMVGRVTRRLRVEEGRLVCDTDRGVEPFGELSPGERWRIALEIAVEQLGRGGIVTVPQEAWESLDPINRQEITQIAKDVGVVILTAEADQQETITAEVAG